MEAQGTSGSNWVIQINKNLIALDISLDFIRLWRDPGTKSRQFKQKKNEEINGGKEVTFDMIWRHFLAVRACCYQLSWLFLVFGKGLFSFLIVLIYLG